MTRATPAPPLMANPGHDRQAPAASDGVAAGVSGSGDPGSPMALMASRARLAKAPPAKAARYSR